jgi:hypothetical protein
VRTRCICSVTGAAARAHDAGMEATTKLQKAGRAFLLRLVAEYGPSEAARVLRAPAEEIDALAVSSMYQHLCRAGFRCDKIATDKVGHRAGANTSATDASACTGSWLPVKPGLPRKGPNTGACRDTVHT